MPGFAKPQDLTNNSTIIGEVSTIDDVANKVFYGFRYYKDTGKLILEILSGDDPVSLPKEDVINDLDYRQWIWTQKSLNFDWNNNNGHLLVEVR
jgi:hypothetical protein